MSDPITIIPQPIGAPQARGSTPQAKASTNGPTFDQLLHNRLDQQDGVKFSRHASQRMQSRGIVFSPTQMQRLESAVSAVNAKGGRESLVMLDSTALVVSVKNETVVTVVDRAQLKNKRIYQYRQCNYCLAEPVLFEEVRKPPTARRGLRKERYHGSIEFSLQWGQWAQCQR